MKKLVINETHKLNQISEDIYGHFAEHLGRCIYEGIFVGKDSDIPNVNGMRTDVVDALKMPSEDFEINTKNLALHPELLKYDKLFQSVAQSELMNQKESQPSFGFGFDYINIHAGPDITFSEKGKDILIGSVIGVIIVLTAYMLVDFILITLTKSGL